MTASTFPTPAQLAALANLSDLALSRVRGPLQAFAQYELDARSGEQFIEGPTCSICDGLGHGYPGAGPCPLEVADYSGEPAWAL